MEYNGTFGKTKIKELGLPYLRGMLHTYAILNQPESNLLYEYDIIQIKKTGDDLKSTLLAEFEIFIGQPFTVALSDENSLRKALLSWLFEENFVSERRSQYIVDCFHADLQHITDFKSIFMINLDFIKYDFGVSYEYFILESEQYWYFLYF